MTFRFSATLLLLLISAPALAQTAAPAQKKDAPSINIHVDPKVSAANNAYEEAVKKLPPAQQAKLKSLEGEYIGILDLDLQAIKASFEVKHCAESSKAFAQNLNNYQAQLGVYSNALQGQSRAARLKHQQKLAAEAAFIDQNLLEAHYAFTANLMMSMGAQLTQIGYQKGAFAQTDCVALAKKLDAAFKHANAPHGGSNQNMDTNRLAQAQAAAARGDPEAMVAVGMLMIAGQGLPKDPQKGLEMLTAAAEKGYPRAQYMLGLALGTDMLGLTPDKEKAKHWMAKAAAQGDKKAEAMLKVMDKEKPMESLETVRKKAEAGDANAAYDLGARYYYGVGGLAKDPAEGRKWMMMAAGSGHALAQSNIGADLLGSDKPEEAVVWVTRAAEKGVVNSQLQLAGLYFAGKLVPRDLEKAAHWCKKAADAGDPRAAQMLKQIEGSK